MMDTFFEKISTYKNWIKEDIRRVAVVMIGGIMIIMGIFVSSIISAPGSFPVGRIVTIPEGASLSEISTLFEEKELVASALAFELVVRASDNDTGVLAGDYFFEEPLYVFDVSQKVLMGEFGIEPIKITIPEGSTIVEIAALFAEKFPKFDASSFLELTDGQEGYLFPDTYHFLQNVEEEQVIQEMQENFITRVRSIEDMIEASPRSFEDIITMASIIEKEAWKEHDRNLISGVLWNRIDIGMPLQVDAAFLYINGKSTYDLTLEDLDLDDPYNTYKYAGLPPGPICNPSLSSIRAAANPEESSYFFYLADRAGTTYYALDFEGHKRNRALYLD